MSTEKTGTVETGTADLIRCEKRIEGKACGKLHHPRPSGVKHCLHHWPKKGHPYDPVGSGQLEASEKKETPTDADTHRT